MSQKSVSTSPAQDRSLLVIGIIVAVAAVTVALIVFGGGAGDPPSVQTRQTNQQFFDQNATERDVITTVSGLQYRINSEGTGTTNPVPTDTVTVNYEGRLLDGTVFDSSFERGTPATFSLGQVIPGWTEGLQLMTPGDNFTFWIPAELGYADNPPQGSGIPPGAILVFDVELINVNGSTE